MPVTNRLDPIVKPTGNKLDPIVKPLPKPTPDISLPPKLGRPPTVNDLIIKRTFDGKTPAAAEKAILKNLRAKVAPENANLVNGTIKQRVRDMQVALNNTFTKGTPNRQFLESKLPAEISVIGSMSGSNPVVYKVTQQGGEPKFYSKSWSGAFVEMPRPPVQVVMEGKLTLDPMGLQMTYPKWDNKALSGPITTITEG
jgi:hypothetical protein